MASVAIFGKVGVLNEHTPAERYHLAQVVYNGKNQSAVKHVVVFVGFLRRNARLFHFGFGVALLFEILYHFRSRYAVPQPEPANQALSHLAFSQIFPRGACRGKRQILVIIPSRRPHEFIQPLPLLSVASVVAVALLELRHFEVGFFGEYSYRLAAVYRLYFAYKVYRVAARLATETVIQSFIRRNGKRSGLFVMKRTAPPIRAALFSKVRVARYYSHNVAALKQFADKFSVFHSLLLVPIFGHGNIRKAFHRVVVAHHGNVIHRLLLGGTVHAAKLFGYKLGILCKVLV